MPLDDGRRNVGRRFSKDRQVRRHGLERLGVRQELIPGEAGDESFDFGNGRQNILNAFFPRNRSAQT